MPPSVSGPLLEGIEVKKTWWDGEDFFVEQKDGTVTRYENAYVSSHSVVLPSDSCLEVLDLEIKNYAP